jgi:Na+/phosphate symporter
MDILIEKNLKQIADVMTELLDIVKKEIKKSEELSKEYEEKKTA